MKVLILGGGASGLMAALSAAQDERNTVTVLERQSRVGRKLLATGNGRCNLTNLDLSPVHYHGQDAGFARAALSRFDGTATLDFFHALGLLTTAEPSGRVYPLSDQSNSVVDVLRFAAAQAGVQLVCGFDAQSVKKKARGYQVIGADGSAYFGDKLIIACGGFRSPREIRIVIDELTADYKEPYAGARKRLSRVLEVMLYAYTAAEFRLTAENLMADFD